MCPVIRPCPSCVPHAFQDKKYGDKMRVKNPCKNNAAVRCTVCGKEEGLGGGKAEDRKKPASS